MCHHTPSPPSSSIHQQSAAVLRLFPHSLSSSSSSSSNQQSPVASIRASCAPGCGQPISSGYSCSNTAMPLDEAIAHCGAWTASPAQSHNHLHNTTAPVHSTNTMDGSSDISTDPSVSSADEHTSADRVCSPTSSASTTAVSGDNALTHSMETQLSNASTDLRVGHGSVSSNNFGSVPPPTPANTHASDHDGPATLTPAGPPLTAASLMAHERTTSALSSSDNSVALWLASGMDPLAAAIEAAVVDGSQS